MNHGLKALLMAAATIITCMIVSLGFRMAREAKQIGSHVVEEMHRYRIKIEEQDLMKYDGVTVYGTDVVNLMKKELPENGNGLRVTVITEGRAMAFECADEVRRAQDGETVYYVTPTKEYTGQVRRDKNEVIVEVVFREKNGGKNE